MVLIMHARAHLSPSSRLEVLFTTRRLKRLAELEDEFRGCHLHADGPNHLWAMSGVELQPAAPWDGPGQHTNVRPRSRGGLARYGLRPSLDSQTLPALGNLGGFTAREKVNPK